MYDAIVIGARCAGSPTAMLLARQGYRVLLVDRASFPSDTISTQLIWPAGIAKLKKWGLLDRLVSTGLPAVTKFTMDMGDFPLGGWGPSVDGVAESYAPRRTVLDKILVDAAVEAGAELREKFSVQGFLTEGDRVVGIRGRPKTGGTVEEKASIIIGADGRNSQLARAVDAPIYNHTPSLSFLYYTYWSGVYSDGYEDYWPGRKFILTVPTNDDLLLIVMGLPIEEFHSFRTDIESNYMSVIDELPGLAERVRAGRREERFVGTVDVPNFFRKPYGDGWALVGDAGYAKDPVTAFGISDAFRDAELLTAAINAAFSGSEPIDETLEQYERTRNELATPQFEITLRAAEFNQHTTRAMELRAALRGKQSDIDRFMGVINGTVPREEFFATENLERILGHSIGRRT